MNTTLNFNAVLLDISNQLNTEQLDSLKHLCKDEIRKGAREKCTTGIQLFELLTESMKLSPGNTDYLSQRLRHIHRQDLCDKLEGLDEQPENQPNEAERVKLDAATEIIADNLGRSWRKLGRKLGLSEVRLDSISGKHPTDLEETTVEMLKEWRKLQGTNARVEDLTQALRLCELKLTAEKVEDKLGTPLHQTD